MHPKSPSNPPSPCKLPLGTQQSSCCLPAAICRRLNAIAFVGQQIRSSVKLSPRGIQPQHPVQFSSLGNCTPAFPPSPHSQSPNSPIGKQVDSGSEIGNGVSQDSCYCCPAGSSNLCITTSGSQSNRQSPTAWHVLHAKTGCSRFD